VVQALDGGEAAHHLGVGQHLGTADVERAVRAGGDVERADQVVQDVADGDRLDSGPHPAWGHHDRQPLGEVTQHLERRAAAADDDRGP